MLGFVFNTEDVAFLTVKPHAPVNVYVLLHFAGFTLPCGSALCRLRAAAA